MDFELHKYRFENWPTFPGDNIQEVTTTNSILSKIGRIDKYFGVHHSEPALKFMSPSLKISK